MPTTTIATPATTLDLVWVDLTRKCNEMCVHCYNDSGPHGEHGSLTREQLLDTLRQAADAGARQVTFIGGEPTLHPDLPDLIEEALRLGLTAGVFSNLVHVTDRLWTLFQRPGVTLATSYYSPDPVEHAQVTGRRTHARIRANIEKALGYGIPLRACIVRVLPGQDVEGALADLRTLGITDISVEDTRPFGRGQRDREPCNPDSLCGHCGRGRAAIGPDGTVTPCIMTDWLPVGNIVNTPLAEILRGPALAEAVSIIPEPRAAPCPPDDGNDCGKNAPACSPAFSTPPPTPPQPRIVPLSIGAR